MIREYSNLDFEFVSNNLKHFQKNISLNEVLNNPFTKIYLYENKGFIIVSKYYERLEIDYIFVLEEYRKNGIASKLINYIIKENKDVENITLEVSVENIPAINLYKKLGFKVVATREKYYNGIDAYLMERK